MLGLRTLDYIEKKEQGICTPNWLVCVVLIGLVWAIYGQTLGFGFVYDDLNYITGNPVVRQGITIKGLWWALNYGEIGHWHPLTWVSHMFDCQIFGSWSGGHHLTNVLIQSAVSVCLFLTLKSLTGCFWRSAMVAALWTVHPLRVESVAWVSERKDVLSGLLFVAVLSAYGGYVRRGGKLRYMLLVGLFALGLLCKNMLVTIPFLLLLLDVWPLKRIGSLRKLNRAGLIPLIVEKLPLLLLSAASCVATFLVQEKVLEADRISLSLRLQNAVISLGVYLRQTFFLLTLQRSTPIHERHILFQK